MKTALVYDRVNKWGGAERVLLALHELFPNAPLYTSVYDKIKAPWAQVFDVKHSFLQHMPFAKNHHELIPFLMPMAFEQFNFDSFDLVISVTSESAKGILTKPKTRHISYCLTPTRYLWSGYEEYFKNKILKKIAAPAVSYLRKWDTHASGRPDKFVALSKEVQKRIKTYYDRESEVVYPGLFMHNNQQNQYKKVQKNDYFLVVSRFVPYKRIDLAIDACNALGLPLVIIGSGKEEYYLRKKAGKTIRFIGMVSDEELAQYYKGARALLFPGIEDFGLTVVEAQKYGTPVIAFRGGGALETINEGKTGLFFDKQHHESLIKAMKIFDGYEFKPDNFKRQTARFSFDNFKSKFLSVVEAVM